MNMEDIKVALVKELKISFGYEEKAKLDLANVKFLCEAVIDLGTDKQIEDLYGFTIFVKEQFKLSANSFHKTKEGYMRFNLMHDVVNIIQEEKCFSPRTNGYAKYIKEF